MDIENTLGYELSNINETKKTLERNTGLSQKIQNLIQANKITVSSILIIVPSIAIPMYHDWRHPVIGMALGFISQMGIGLMSVEQISKHKGEGLT